MLILKIDPTDVDGSIAQARDQLETAMTDDGKTLVIVRGDSPAIKEFAEMVSFRCDTVPWREAIWVVDREIFEPEIEEMLFDERPADQYYAVIVDESHIPRSWPPADIMDWDLIQDAEGLDT